MVFLTTQGKSISIYFKTSDSPHKYISGICKLMSFLAAARTGAGYHGRQNITLEEKQLDFYFQSPNKKLHITKKNGGNPSFPLTISIRVLLFTWIQKTKKTKTVNSLPKPLTLF